MPEPTTPSSAHASACSTCAAPSDTSTIARIRRHRAPRHPPWSRESWPRFAAVLGHRPLALAALKLKASAAPLLFCTSPCVTIAPGGADPSVRRDHGRYLTQSYRVILAENAPIGVLSGSIALSLPASVRQIGGAAMAGGGEVALAQPVSVPVRGEVAGEIAASPGIVLFDVVHHWRGQRAQDTSEGGCRPFPAQRACLQPGPMAHPAPACAESRPHLVPSHPGSRH